MTVCMSVTWGGKPVTVNDTSGKKAYMFPLVMTGGRSMAYTGGMENSAMTAIFPLVTSD